VSRNALALLPADLPENSGRVLGVASRRLSDFEQEIVGVFVGLAQGVGLPKSYGEIYGLLFASAQPLDFTTIQERLELSKGSVSQGLRALREIGAVAVAEGPDERRERYVAATELRQLIGALLRGTVEPQLALGETRLAKAARLLGREKLSPAEARTLSHRLDKLQAWHRKAGGMLPWIAKFLG
jgi:DNA-binding transcriptional regulator GbsR (MarR family)